MIVVSVEFSDEEYERMCSLVEPTSIPRMIHSFVLDSIVPKREGEEEWRQFRTGEYDVSSFGNIRRMKAGHSTFIGRPLKPITTPTGYSGVGLRIGGKNIRLYVHRVVAEAFFGVCPKGFVVNHKDGNKKNNAVSNLEYASHSENAVHAIKNLPRHRGPTKPPVPLKGRPKGEAHWSYRNPEKIARGEKMGGSKITADIVNDIRDRVAMGETQCSAAKLYNISVAQVSRIVRGTRWAHVPQQLPPLFRARKEQ